MNPRIARTIADEHHATLRRRGADSRRGPVRRLRTRLPGWRDSWSRTVLSADATRCRGSCLVII